MKSRILFALLFCCYGILIPVMLTGQSPYVSQVISANSGKFEFAPPYNDFVTVQSNNPVTGAGSVVNTIFTQSVQDICIQGNIAWIAAQDSLIKLNLDNHQRMAGIADSGLSKILVFGDKLVLSKQYPLSTFFAEVLNINDMSLVASIPGIPGDCGGIAAVGDSVYIAVNGGWMGSEGKIAVIETTGWTVARIINLGSEAIGIMNIYAYGNKLFTVNKSPYSSPDKGSISVYNLSDHTFVNHLLNKNVGTGAGIDGHLLYFGYDYGIGSFNMNSMQVENSAVVSDPGSALFRYITSSALDTLNNRIFVNVGDYISPGTCIVSGFNGDSLFSYTTGISTDAIAIDYRIAPTGIDGRPSEELNVMLYPNPAADQLFVKLNNQRIIDNIVISDMFGKAVLTKSNTHETGEVGIAVGNLKPGVYSIMVESESYRFSAKFLKK